MKRDQFLTEVQERAEFDDEQTADDAAEAVLRTLGERIAGGEADDLAAQLPDGIDEYVATDEGEQFDFAEFTDRVGERLDADASPKHASQAVAGAVVDAASTGEFQDVVSELPKNEGYGELLALADESAS